MEIDRQRTAASIKKLRYTQEKIRISSQAPPARICRDKQAHILAGLIRESAQPVAIGRTDGRIGLVNRAFEQLTGYSEQQLLRLSWDKVLTPAEYRQIDRKELAHLRQTGVPVRYEKEFIRKDGTRVPVELLVHLLKTDQGKPKYYFAIINDISERKKADKALRDSHKQLEEELSDYKLLQSTSTQLIQENHIEHLYKKIVDAAVCLMHSDCASLQMVSHESDEPSLELLASYGFCPGVAQFWNWVDGRSNSSCGVALRKKQRVIIPDMEQCDFLAGSKDRQTYRRIGIRAAQSTPLLSRAGKLVGMISTHWKYPHTPSERKLAMLDILARQAADLIEERKAEAALEQRVEQRTAQVQKQADHLRALANRLHRTEQIERKRLAKILHDHIQQLIVAAKMQASWMQKEHLLDNLHEAAKDIETILAEAVAASRSLAVDLSPPVLSENGLIDALHWLAKRMQEHYHFTVNLNIGTNVEPAGEEMRFLIFECVREILLNSVKHSGVSQAELTFFFENQASCKVIVADKGRGFDPGLLERRNSDKPTFGLFSIKERLLGVNGQMHIETSPGEGTCITISVPAEKAPEEAAQTPHNESSSETLNFYDKTDFCRVLLVDDHEIVREGLVRMLQFEPDIEVVAQAATAAEALQMTEEHNPDIIIMDVNLGATSGVQAAKQILARHPDCRIIGLSMHFDREIAEAMLAAGAVKYLTKDNPSKDLVAAIRTHWQQT